MQKKLIALAVAGLVSGAAFAQTNVTIYGAADATLELVQAKGAEISAQNVDRFSRVNSNSSILGFRGSEDLGGGLKAIFQFETGITHDQSGASTFGRDTFVGLQGGFGQIKAGLITGPARSLGAAVDLTVGATGIGANTPMLGKLGGNAGAAFSYWDTRRSNAVQYVTPKFGGFEVRAMYGAGENQKADSVAGNRDAGRTYELGGFYNNGPWYAGLTYGQVKPESTQLILAPTGTKQTNIRLAGAYTFQAGHKITALFEQTKADDVAAYGNEDVKSYTYGIGGKFKVSQPGAIIAQVYQVGKLKGAVEANDYKANFITIGYEHALSKRTVLKAYYSRIDNKELAQYNYGIGNIGGTAGAAPTGTGLAGGIGAGSNPTGFAVGIRHSF
ncbi:MAG: porin [Candidatus Accumulibacter sp.]|jgi:predicted porin|nr:porin [Accumulibacter sp.]